MSDFFFVIKTMTITVIVVFLMQIKIGGATIEQKALAWIQASSVTDTLRDVASGAVKAGDEAYGWVRAKIEGASSSSSGSSKARRHSHKNDDEI